jgi:ATP-binding cassette subfamily C protein CydCD
LTGKLAARSEARQAAARGRLTESVVDLFEGAPELIVNGAAPEQLRRTLAADAQLTHVAQATSRTEGIGQGLTSLCCGLAMWGSLLVGVDAVHTGHLDGVLLAGIALIPLVAFELVTGLPAATQTLQRVRQAAARVQEVLDTPSPVIEPTHPRMLDTPPPLGGPAHPPMPAKPSRQLTGGESHRDHVSYGRPSLRDTHEQRSPHLRARGLSYVYPGKGNPALSGIDLDLSPGRRVAIVGPSGAGKSTLAGVLLRFLPYQSGSVELDGLEASQLDGDEIRRVVGLVSQDTHVFDSTLEENLRLARREATVDELREALAEARLLDWVDGLPLGLATELGERGARMSGGQRQRLAIARAVLANFPILILDEPGEHLDTQTSDAIVGDLLADTCDRATLLITHRLAQLDEVDEVIALDHGQALERGTHTELVERDGYYAEMWRREIGKGVEA